MKYSIEIEQMIVDVTQATDPKLIKLIVWNLRQQFKHSTISYEDMQRLYSACTTRMDEIADPVGFIKSEMGAFFADIYLKVMKANPQNLQLCRQCLRSSNDALNYGEESLKIIVESLKKG